MPDILDVIQAASENDEFLESMVALHQGRVLVAIEELRKNITNIMSELETTNGGRLIGPKVNLKQAQQVHKQLVKEFEKQFNIEVDSMLGDFSEISKQVQKSYGALGEAVKFTNVDKVMMDTLRDQTYKQYAQFGEMARDDIANAMYNHVLGGAKFSSLLDTVTGVLTGHKDVRGRPMTAYAKQFANDSVMDFHNQVNLAKGDELGLNHYLYYGDIMATSRDFCIKRVGKVYTRNQIDAWNDMSWAGKAGPAFENRGGYNCRHHWRPVKKEWMVDVAEEDVTREEIVGYIAASEGDPNAQKIIEKIAVVDKRNRNARSALWNKNKKLSSLVDKNSKQAIQLKVDIELQKKIIESTKLELSGLKLELKNLGKGIVKPKPVVVPPKPKPVVVPPKPKPVVVPPKPTDITALREELAAKEKILGNARSAIWNKNKKLAGILDHNTPEAKKLINEIRAKELLADSSKSDIALLKQKIKELESGKILPPKPVVVPPKPVVVPPKPGGTLTELTEELALKDKEYRNAKSQIWNKKKKLESIVDKNSEEAKKLKSLIAHYEGVADSAKLEVASLKKRIKELGGKPAPVKPGVIKPEPIPPQPKPTDTEGLWERHINYQKELQDLLTDSQGNTTADYFNYINFDNFPGGPVDPWRYFAPQPGWENTVRAKAYELHEKVFESKMDWYRSLSRKEKDDEKYKLINKMLSRNNVTQYNQRNSFIGGTRHMSYRLLSELERNGIKIDWDNAPGRAYFSSGFGKVALYSNSNSSVVSHELAHAIDSLAANGFRGGFGETGFVWRDGGKYLGSKERKKVRSFFAKQHNGSVGVYGNGDGKYFKNGWINDYEGRIYNRSDQNVADIGHNVKKLEPMGQEFWSMNVQRYANARKKTSNLLGLDTSNYEWNRVRKKYPEMAEFIEWFFEVATKT